MTKLVSDTRARLDALCAPTHRVTVTYASGKVIIYNARNAREAGAFAVRESQNVGKELIDRDTGAKVRQLSVTVSTN